MVTSSRVTKLGLALGFVVLAVGVQAARARPSSGYELSIYESTPALFWVAIVAALTLGIAILTTSGLTPRPELDTAAFGGVLLVMALFATYSLPGLRNYLLYNPVDPAAHIGFTKDIVTYGRLGADNIYPITHVFLAQLSLVSGVSTLSLARYVAPIMSIVYVVSIYLLAKELFHSQVTALIALAASAVSPLGYLHTAVYPQGTALLSMPLLLLFYLRSAYHSNVPNRLTLVLSIAVLPLIHPLPALIMVGFIATAELTKPIWRSAGMQENGKTNLRLGRSIASGLILIPIIVLLTWIAGFSIFSHEVHTIRRFIESGFRLLPPQLSAVGEAFQLGTWELLEYTVRQFGATVMMAAAGGIAVLMLLTNTFRRRDLSLGALRLFAIWLPITEVFGVVGFFLLQAQVVSRLIVSDILVILSPVLFAFLVIWLKDRLRRSQKTLPAVASAWIIVATMLATFSLYRSPYTFQFNWQATRMDLAATDWLLDNKLTAALMNSLGYPHALLAIAAGMEESTSRNPYLIESQARIGYFGWYDIPEHFWYRYDDTPSTDMPYGFESIADLYREQGGASVLGGTQYSSRWAVRYWIISARAIIISSDQALTARRVASNPEMARWDFDARDFSRLEVDPGVARVYSNGETNIYYIAPPYLNS